jgi:hypothetical protein
MAASNSNPVTGLPFPKTPEVIFTNWLEALHRSGLSLAVQTVYAMAINGYLDYCTHSGLSVTISSDLHARHEPPRPGPQKPTGCFRPGT